MLRTPTALYVKENFRALCKKVEPRSKLRIITALYVKENFRRRKKEETSRRNHRPRLIKGGTRA